MISSLAAAAAVVLNRWCAVLKHELQDGRVWLVYTYESLYNRAIVPKQREKCFLTICMMPPSRQ